MPLYTMVRGDKLAKYTPPSCSARLRRQNAIRSSSRPDSPFAPATNSWASSGSTARAPAPQASASYGTSRQPSTAQSLGRGEAFDGGGYHGPFGRNEGQAGRIGAWSGQRETADGAEERVRHLGEDPGPVAGARVAALRAAVFQVAEHLQGTGHHIMTAPAGQVRDKTDAARVMLKSGVVKARRRHAFSCRLDNAASRPGRHWPCYIDITSPEESSTRSALGYVLAGGAPLARVRYRPATAAATTAAPASWPARTPGICGMGPISSGSTREGPDAQHAAARMNVRKAA